MSIFGAMQSGISALASQSSSMGAISDNIANINTVGYKSTNVAFSTLVTKQASSSLYSPGGVRKSGRRPFFMAWHSNWPGGLRVVDRWNLLVCHLNPNRSLETELALFLMTAIRKMRLYIVGS